MTIESMFRAASRAKKPHMRAMWLEKAGRLAVTDPERPTAPDFDEDLSGRGYVGPLDPRRLPRASCRGSWALRPSPSFSTTLARTGGNHARYFQDGH